MSETIDRPTAEESLPAYLLHEFLLYEPESGFLYWRNRSEKWFTTDMDHKLWNAKWAGKRAGGINGYGYVKVDILGRRYKAHRVIMAMLNGHWPESEVDHIDHDRANNRQDNLRLATGADNNKNKRLSKINTSGAAGVTWSKSRRKWCAAIGVGGRTLRLGHFAAFRDARAARREAERAHGFHENHGHP